MTKQALIPYILDRVKSSSSVQTAFAYEIALCFAGVLFLALTAQIVIPLWWTPVPLTGQSFGVLLLALLWGRHRGLSVVSAYVALGFFGAPIFAAGATLMTAMGPTTGYLLGMVLAAFGVGFLADKGLARSFSGAFLAAIMGTFVILVCGTLVLAQWIPSGFSSLLVAGFWPFIPGGLVKSALAAFIASKLSKSLAKSSKRGN